MKRLPKRVFLAFAVAIIAAVAIPLLLVAAATLIDDTFADGSSQNQDLPNNSIRIFKGRSATTRTDAVGSVIFTPASTSSEAFWGYFTNSGAPVTLGVGDRVSVAETFQLTGLVGTSQDIRGGLLDSKGTRNTDDLGGGQNDATFAGDTGYGVQFYPSGTGSAFVIGRRLAAPASPNNPFNGFVPGDFANISGEPSPARQTLTNNIPYTLTYSVERLTETQTRISVSVVGGTLSNLNYSVVEDSPTPATTFDYFTYRIGGTAFASSVKFTKIQVEYSPAVPIITTQPAPSSRTVAVGSNVTFSIGASGNGLTYQWRRNAVNIQGATAATLNLTNVQTGDSGAYDVVVSNTSGSVTSSPVALTVSDGQVEPSPVITAQPPSQTITVNSPITFSVAATGSGLSYQWFKNGTLITGATGATYTIASAQISDSANYTVTVSNAGGSVTSNPASLTVVSAMQIVSVAPVSGALDVCVDSPLAVTFNQVPQIGNTGRLRVYKSDGTLVDTIDFAGATQSKIIGGFSFNYYPIIVSGNTANIYLRAQLAYNSTYYVTLEPGVLKDASNAPFAGFSDQNTVRFSTRAAAPTAGKTSLTVGGSGADFCTVQGAIDFVPAGNTNRTTITVKNGIQTEINLVPSNKPFITVRGETRGGAIIQYANNNNFNPASTVARTMFGVEAADFNLENITLHNTTAQGGSQAEALRLNGSRANVIQVNLKSFQDTLLTTKSAFVTDSYIEGDVDFMWGGGSTFFRNSEIKMLRENLGYYTQIRNGAANYGNVYVNCRLTKAANVTNGSFLSRIDPDDFPGSQVVFIDTQMDSHIRPVGWQFDNPTNAVTAANYPNIRFWEYNTTTLDGVTPVDCSQRHPISRNACNNPLTADEAAFYRVPSNITGFAVQEKLTALVTLNGATVAYNGAPKTLSATTDPAGLNVTITYNGSPNAPTSVGTYTVVATVNDADYQGSATATLTITQAAATFTLGNMNHVFDGNAKQAAAATVPANLSVTLTYNGASSLPVNPGSYTVVATASDTNYTGSATGILTIFPNRAKAFPEAEGYGAYALGGRNGDVYHVTNLNDAGAGSLRFGIQNAPANGRTIVFDLSGTIHLQSRLNINKPFITIAGQTAPGEGITVAGETTVVNNTNDIIIRYVRFRAGDARCANGFEGDSLWVDNSTDVIIDQVSASWSIDETLSVTNSNRVTVQWSLIVESLRNSCHSNGTGGTEPHGYGSLLRYGNGTMTFHHNLYAHHSNRNPRIGDDLSVDWVNNVIYNWSINPGYTAAADEGSPHINYTNNYSIAGPNTPTGSARNRAFTGGSLSTLIFQSGNFIDSNVNGTRDGADTGLAQFVGSYTLQPARFDFPLVRTESAAAAYERVLSFAGSTFNTQSFAPEAVSRDAVDARIIGNVRNDTGGYIDTPTQVGGYPTLNSLPAPTDTDGDGMPDAYENANNLNSNSASDAGTISGNGRSNLENYLNSLASVLAPIASPVAVGGRVVNAAGRGIGRIRIVCVDEAGVVRQAMTNPFGYYRFGDIAAERTYIFSVTSKKYVFGEPTRVVSVTGAIEDLNFVANQ